jgi:hypothetical protein
MARGYTIQEEEVQRPLFRRILIGLLTLALLVSVPVGLVLHVRTLRAEQALEQFDAAMEAGRFGEAVSVYRSVREKALADGADADPDSFYRSALDAMERQSGAVLSQIEHKLDRGIALSSEEITLAEGLEELSASRLITALRALGRRFLLMEIERGTLDLAFSQLENLANVRQGVSGLSDEFNRMEALRPQAAQAAADLAAGRYWASWEAWQQLLAQGDLGGFTREQLLEQAENCQKMMYAPLMDHVRTLMDGGRYLSAEHELKSLQAVFPDQSEIARALEQCAPYVPDKLEAYQGPIEFITVKPLINNPAKAFDGDAYAAAAQDSMLTTSEFSAMLEALYANGFILIDADRLYDEERQLQTLRLPAGKKPLVLVLEGLNYYVTRRETGNSWDLVLDEGGEVAAQYMDAEGHLVVDRRGEAIGILDLFVADHPDFALDGAKGTISLTGYEGVFGRITDRDQLDDRNKALQDHGMAPVSLTDQEIEANRAAVREIVERLKETGWIFASSTYGFINAREQDLARIKTDTEKWLGQVGSLTGPVSILHYPNGAFITGSDERAHYLKEQDFVLFGGIGSTAYLYLGDRYIYVDKVPVNGYTLRNSGQFGLERFFGSRRILDR